MDVCYDSSYFRDTLHDQIGSEHVPVYVNERVSSRFWCDSCCMTKHDQISSGVSHRPSTEGTGESSSRNYVFFIFFYLLNFLNFLKFCDVRRKGVGLCPYMGNGCVYVLIWFPPWVFGVHKMFPSLLLMEHLLNKKYEKLM